MVQIGGYLTPEEHAEFRRYAMGLHLKDSSLANLLLARELRLRRMAVLKQLFPPPAPLKERSRITAHQSDPAIKQAFEALARGAGISADQAAAILFRAELAERWLATAIDQVEST